MFESHYQLQNKRTSAKQMSFYSGFRRPKGGSTLRDFNARGGRSAPAPRFSPAAKTLVRRTCAAVQKGRLAVLLQRSRPSKISILTVPSYKGTSAGCPFCLLLLRTGCRQQIKSVSAGEFPQTRFWIQGVYSKTAPEVSTLWPQRLSMSVPLPENTEPSK